MVYTSFEMFLIFMFPFSIYFSFLSAAVWRFCKIKNETRSATIGGGQFSLCGRVLYIVHCPVDLWSIRSDHART